MTGVTLGSDFVARWLETPPPFVQCVEVAAEGFFGRPSPFLRHFGEAVPLVVQASRLPLGVPDSLTHERLDEFVAVCTSARPRAVIYPIGVRTAAGVHLPATVPLRLNPATLAVAIAQVAQVVGVHRCPVLVEAPPGLTLAPGTLAAHAFWTHLCRETGAQLLVDTGTVVATARNAQHDLADVIRAIPPELIGAVRVSGVALRRERWWRDTDAAPDAAVWHGCELLSERAQPELLFYALGDRQEDAAAVGPALARMTACGSTRAVAAGDTGGTSHEETESGMARPRVRPGVALFVLDDAGVVISESRRELTLLNTAATLVWCLVEEDRSLSDIVRTYGAAFDVAEAEARRHVVAALRQWFGVDYIDIPPIDGDATMSLESALSYLLGSASLRAAFRAAPDRVGRQLGVHPDERAAFAAIDADDVDAQGDELSDLVVEATSPLPPLAPIAAHARPAALPSTARRYRLATTLFAVDAETPDAADLVHDALSHLAADGSPDVVLDLGRDTSGAWTLRENGVVVATPNLLEGIVPAVKQVMRLRAVEQHPFLVNIHAGVVSFGRGCVLLPASSGRGKTTLTAALVHAGARYLSDEVALLDQETLAVRPVPLSFTVKDGSVDVLRTRYPELERLPVHVREDFVRVRYLRPPAEAVAKDHTTEPGRWLVFPRYDGAAETALHPVARPVALQRLLGEAFLHPDRLTVAHTRSAIAWFRQLECFDLPFSSLDSAVDLVRGLASGR